MKRVQMNGVPCGRNRPINAAAATGIWLAPSGEQIKTRVGDSVQRFWNAWDGDKPLHQSVLHEPSQALPQRVCRTLASVQLHELKQLVTSGVRGVKNLTQ
jgi:hypothetical protein